MRNNIQTLKPEQITSDVFIIAPSQIETISNNFGDAVAEAMNVRPLSPKFVKLLLKF